MNIKDFTCPECGSVPRILSLLYDPNSVETLKEDDGSKNGPTITATLIDFSVVCWNWHLWTGKTTGKKLS